jgi:hypothetical protein
VYEPQIRPTVMNDAKRREFVQKAKANRLAFDAAEMLSRGESDKAATVGGQCLTVEGREQFAFWLRHYATTRFKVASLAVDEFLTGMKSADIAL